MHRWIVSACLLLGSVFTGYADQWNDIWAYGHHGLQAAKKKDYATARRDFDVAVRQYPKVAVAYYNRGRFFYGRHEYALALNDFNMAVSLRPTVWNYAYIRGITCERLGRYDMALADYNQILRLHPSDQSRASLLNERAWIEATCPDPRYRNGNQAIEDAKVAVHFGRGLSASYLDTLAAAYAEAGDFDAAIKCEEQAIAAQTKNDKLRDPNGPLSGYRQHRPFRVQPSKAEAPR